MAPLRAFARYDTSYSVPGKSTGQVDAAIWRDAISISTTAASSI
jgi:hypothetical protein